MLSRKLGRDAPKYRIKRNGWVHETTNPKIYLDGLFHSRDPKAKFDHAMTDSKREKKKYDLVDSSARKYSLPGQ